MEAVRETARLTLLKVAEVLFRLSLFATGASIWLVIRLQTKRLRKH
jgi:hypothetical protein